ncbi:GtrA-like protein [Ruegeria sp. THAF57]|uniref:GtrA family protein n=1 Tax=Ruegeria sp. THAF57 TaxID=2744555 RepID=UPI0015E015EA|nr:GtrA family protein [Ruegeria sp. THAF57]CAD0183193.1 GtrA-like protein [Ruegeria sp. THAF57]
MSEPKRIFRFAVVGTGVAAYYFVTYLGLLQIFNSPWIANLLAFGSAILIQYVGQTVWTFGRPVVAPGQFGRFLCMIAIGLVVSSMITGILAPRLALAEPVAAGLVVVVLPIINFVILRLWVYREESSI